MSKHVAVVGAGMVGLSTAWFLREHGVEVTVLDRAHVAAGSSWGNAGWLTPTITTPLPEPAVLRYGLRTVLQPSSPVYVPVRPDVRLWRFLTGFARHCTPRAWRTAMRAYGPVNRRALDAFDLLADAGAAPRPLQATPFLMAYRTAAEREAMVEELAQIARIQPVEYDLISGTEAREIEPVLSDEVGAAVALHGQRYLNPPVFVAALGESVVARGAKLHEGVDVRSVRDEGTGVVLTDAGGQEHRYDGAVLATGAVLNRLAGSFGVRRLVQAGRGYSFSVECEQQPRGPVYLPTERVACTPLETATGPRFRVAGMMEFRSPDEPLDQRRIDAIVQASAPFLRGVDLQHRQDEWVGSRPCTTDGLPLVGASSSPRVHVAGGHGMWGIVLGPLTGQLLAEQVVTGVMPPELTPFDPLR